MKRKQTALSVFVRGFLFLVLTGALVGNCHAWTFHLPPNAGYNIPIGVTVHLGDYWVKTLGTNMRITSWFTNNWINYTVNGVGTQQIYGETKPSKVYIDGSLGVEGLGWNYTAGDIIFVLNAGSSVWIKWEATQPITGNPPQIPKLYYSVRIFVCNGSMPLLKEVCIGFASDRSTIKYVNRTDRNGLAMFSLEPGTYFATANAGAYVKRNATFTVPDKNYAILNFAEPFMLSFSLSLNFCAFILIIAILVSSGVVYALKRPRKWKRGEYR